MGEDGAAVGRGDALGDREVELFHGPPGELLAQRLVGGVVFRDDQAAGGVLVEAVDDARAFDPADAGKLAFAVVEQGVDQRAVGITRGGVDDDAGFLVEDDQVLVFEQDAQRDVLRLGQVGDGFRDGNAEDVADRHRVAQLDRLVEIGNHRRHWLIAHGTQLLKAAHQHH